MEGPNSSSQHFILQLLGTLILWFGWYGFNSGSALVLGGAETGDILATQAGTTTTLSAGAGGIVALFYNYVHQKRLTGVGQYDLVHTMNGVLSGAVAVTASCAVIEPWAAVIVGSVAGVLYLYGSQALIKFRIDDAVDAIPVHLINGIWGLLATGLFATPTHLQEAYRRSDHVGLFYSGKTGGVDFTLFGAQFVAVCFILTWVGGIMLPFFMLLERMGKFRASAMEEVLGLDRAYFGGQQQGGVEDDWIDKTRE